MPKKKKNTAKKQVIKTKQEPAAISNGRSSSFRLRPTKKYDGPKLPSAFRIFKNSLDILWKHKGLFTGVLVIYGLLQLVLVQGILSSNFTEVSDAVKDVLGNQWHGLASGLTLFTYLLGSVGQTNSAEASTYQSLLLVIGSLAFIWALRQVMAGQAVRIRDAYYKGMYPLVPFILVLVVIGLQTIPLITGAWLYGTIVENGIAATAIEQTLWLIAFLLLSALSIYMICASLFALYIVTLPDMTPIKALKSARKLAQYRRLSIFRKLLFILLVTLLIPAAVMLPVISFVPIGAPIMFYLVIVTCVGLIHTYMYLLYRELLGNE